MKEGKNIVSRFAIIWFFIFVCMLFIVVNIIKIQTVEREHWLELLKNKHQKTYSVRPERGNIYSSNGELMASSLPIYHVYMDTRVEALHLGRDTLFYHHIDSLSYCLSKYFGDKSPSEYKKRFIRAFKKGEAEHQFYKNSITYMQFEEIKKFPLFRRGRFKSGLIYKEQFQRVKPFGTLASRTIGDIYADETRGGKNGLELGFDSILRGKKGISRPQKIANRVRNIVEVPPVAGLDLVTTLDVDIQDIAEKSLLEKLKEIDAQTGYALVMEVKTGEIKAIVNMDRVSEGVYREVRNGAVADKLEPGSTFKVASLMAVLDDGKATLEDSVETGNGRYLYGRTEMPDHNANRGGYGTITLENAINASSNIGISRTIVKAYGDHPEQFVEKLYKMGLNEPFQLHIPGTAKPSIRHPHDTTRHWYGTTLPWMSIGYEVQIPPIYTLAFFNAIANDGKYLEPLLVKSISQDGQVVQSFDAKVIREQICKPSTIEAVKKTLLGVVEHPKYGTAKPVHSTIVRIAGKTGTAQISKGKSGYKSGGVSHQVSFCGFFPYENPQYTCIVVIREPNIGIPSGGRMAGVVVKDIAEKTMSITNKITIDDMLVDSLYSKTKFSIPLTKSTAIDTVLKVLGTPIKRTDSQWISLKYENNRYEAIPFDIPSQWVPNLIGLGAKDALYLCNQLGMKATIKGVGKVKKQSLSKGMKIQKSMKIELFLQ